jgi:hypothetical protein
MEGAGSTVETSIDSVNDGSSKEVVQKFLTRQVAQLPPAPRLTFRPQIKKVRSNFDNVRLSRDRRNEEPVLFCKRKKGDPQVRLETKSTTDETNTSSIHKLQPLLGLSELTPRPSSRSTLNSGPYASQVLSDECDAWNTFPYHLLSSSHSSPSSSSAKLSAQNPIHLELGSSSRYPTPPWSESPSMSFSPVFEAHQQFIGDSSSSSTSSHSGHYTSLLAKELDYQIAPAGDRAALVDKQLPGGLSKEDELDEFDLVYP